MIHAHTEAIDDLTPEVATPETDLSPIELEEARVQHAAAAAGLALAEMLSLSEEAAMALASSLAARTHMDTKSIPLGIVRIIEAFSDTDTTGSIAFRREERRASREQGALVMLIAPEPLMETSALIAHFLTTQPEHIAERLIALCDSSCDALSTADPEDETITNQVARVVSLTMKIESYYREQEDDAIREQILPSVQKVVSQFTERIHQYVEHVAITVHSPGVDLDIECLVHEGMLGLYEALKKFDLHAAENFDFRGYAYKRIRGNMIDAQRALGGSFGRVSRTKTTLIKGYQELVGQGLTSEEAIATLGTTHETIGRILQYNSLSLDTPAETDSDLLLGEMVPANTLGPEEMIERADTISNLSALIDELDERTADMVRRRFALPPYSEPEALKAIGEKYGITESRASQIMKETLRDLGRLMSKDVTG